MVFSSVEPYYTTYMKLGVFDSGIGGKAVAEFLQRQFPAADVIRVDDHRHVPYGDKPLDTVRTLTDAAIQPLLSAGCDIIVLACNTATAASIEFLRAKYPNQKFIGLEPMIKPASEQTKTGVIAICATPATLSSERYGNLKRTYGNRLTILEPDCSEWARLIEDSRINEAQIRRTIEDLLARRADVIVLGCTHYHWIRALIEDVVADRDTILDPSLAITARIKQLLEMK